MEESTKVEFTGVCKVRLKYTTGAKSSQLVNTKMLFEVSDNIDKSKYLDNEELPTQEGCKAMTMVFTQALVGCVKLAKENGWLTSEENIKNIFAEIQRGIDADIVIDKSYFNED